jgi:nucleoside-diphosphate-sugar epimerase
MRILITGSNGYIASAARKHLESQGHEIIKLNRSVCNLLDKKQVDDYFENFTCDVVIHTAVSGGSRLEEEKEDIISNNLDMFCGLLRHREKYKKFIHFGSGAQQKVESYYGISKRAIAGIIDKLDLFYNIKIYGLFDINEIDTRFIKANVRRALSGEDIVVHKNKRMDFFHMKDLMVLIDYYINNKDLNKNIDCSYKTSLTLVDIASIIKDNCNSKINIKIEQDGCENYYGNNTDYLNDIIDSDFVPRLLETIKALKDIELK